MLGRTETIDYFVYYNAEKHELDFYHTDHMIFITNENIYSLCEFIKKYNVQSLNLSRSFMVLTEDSAKQLAECSFSSLDLSFNTVGRNVKELVKSTTLKTLILQGCDINDEGAQALIRNKLTSLDLSYNRFDNMVIVDHFRRSMGSNFKCADLEEDAYQENSYKENEEKMIGQSTAHILTLLTKNQTSEDERDKGKEKIDEDEVEELPSIDEELLHEMDAILAFLDDDLFYEKDRIIGSHHSESADEGSSHRPKF